MTDRVIFQKPAHPLYIGMGSIRLLQFSYIHCFALFPPVLPLIRYPTEINSVQNTQIIFSFDLSATMFSEIIFLLSACTSFTFFCIALFIGEGNETSFPPIMNNTACTIPIQELCYTKFIPSPRTCIPGFGLSIPRLGIDRPRLKSTFFSLYLPTLSFILRKFFFNSLNVFC